MVNGESKYFFGFDSIKRFATGLLTIETEKIFKYNKQILFTTEAESYHTANNKCNIGSKLCISRLRDHWNW